MSKWTSVRVGLPEVKIGADWDGFVSDGKDVFRARIYVAYYDAITGERELKCRGMEDHVYEIPMDWITHWRPRLDPPQEGK